MMAKKKERRSIALFIGLIIAVAYGIYIIGFFGSAVAESEDAVETISAGLAGLLVMPHTVLLWIGIVFNFVAWAFKQRWAALTCGILYSVSMVMFMLYAPFVLPEMVLSFVAFARLKKAPLAVRI